MELPPGLTSALRSLTDAVNGLEDAVARRREVEAARTETLLQGNAEIATRLGRVAASLRTIAEREGEPALHRDPA